MPLKVERKTYIFIFLSVFVLIATSWSAFSVTRIISPTQDDVVTFIRNSNGKYNSSSGSELQWIINDLGNEGGSVWIGDDITLTSEIAIDIDGTAKTIIDFQGHTVTLGSDISFINVTDAYGLELRNVRINISNGHTAPIILLYAYNPTPAWLDDISFCLFEDITINNPYDTEYNWTGIHCHVVKDSLIFRNTFRNINMDNVGTGILLEESAGAYGGYGNGNIFDIIYMDRFEVMVEFDMDASVSGFNNNEFHGIKGQTYDYTTYGFKGITNSTNTFENCHVWDWFHAENSGTGVYAWEITSDAHAYYIELSDNIDDCAINSSNGIIVDHYKRNLKISSIARYFESGDYLKLFESSDTNPTFFIYGNDTVTGVREYASFQLDASGTFVINHVNGSYIHLRDDSHGDGIYMFPDSNVTTLNDILRLPPRSLTPTSPTEGMVFANSTSNHLMYYNGTAWVQLDN